MNQRANRRQETEAPKTDWNRRNPERVREAQRRYYERLREMRANMSTVERAQQELSRILRRLDLNEREQLLVWGAEHFLNLELEPPKRRRSRAAPNGNGTGNGNGEG